LPITFGTPVSSRLDVRQSGILCGIAVTTAIAHTAPGELDVWVVAPSGASAALTRRSGGEADNVFNGTHWSDKGQSLATMHDYKNNVLAPSLVPEGALSALVGEEVSGVWSLEIRDRLAGNDGVLGDYTLDLRICECES
jgi:subtilisin-like proprotein convertase family protein